MFIMMKLLKSYEKSFQHRKFPNFRERKRSVQKKALLSKKLFQHTPQVALQIFPELLHRPFSLVGILFTYSQDFLNSWFR